MRSSLEGKWHIGRKGALVEQVQKLSVACLLLSVRPSVREKFQLVESNRAQPNRRWLKKTRLASLDKAKKVAHKSYQRAHAHVRSQF